MSADAIIAQAATDVMGVLGQEVTYSPSVGDPVTVSAYLMPWREDEPTGRQTGRARTRSVGYHVSESRLEVHVLKSAIASVDKKCEFTINSTEYDIKKVIDEDKAWWYIRLDEVAS